VKWVNGSGKDMTGEAADNGWRNSRKSIGYDLIQLNHYALRSAESFLVKRQRGRAPEAGLVEEARVYDEPDLVAGPLQRRREALDAEALVAVMDEQYPHRAFFIFAAASQASSRHSSVSR